MGEVGRQKEKGIFGWGAANRVRGDLAWLSTIIDCSPLAQAHRYYQLGTRPPPINPLEEEDANRNSVNTRKRNMPCGSFAYVHPHVFRGRRYHVRISIP